MSPLHQELRDKQQSRDSEFHTGKKLASTIGYFVFFSVKLRSLLSLKIKRKRRKRRRRGGRGSLKKIKMKKSEAYSIILIFKNSLGKRESVRMYEEDIEKRMECIYRRVAADGETKNVMNWYVCVCGC